MSKKTKPKKQRNFLAFRDGFGIGDLDKIVAERDSMLAQYYVGHDLYFARALNREDDATVFIGPKGIGKSAILQMVRLHEDANGNLNRIIEIAPDDLAFNALINIQERSPILQSAGDNRWLFKSLWDYVLCVAILEREHGNPGAIAQAIRNLFGSKHEKEQQRLLKAALDDSGKSKSMTDKILSLIEEIEVHGSIAGSEAGMRVKTREGSDEKKTGSDLNTLQLINNVAKQLPKQLNHEYYVLIDDLDLHWRGTALQNAFLGSLFFSIRKLSWNNSLKFVVSLRKKIFREIDLEERDKFSPLVCEVNWRPELVKQMLDKRLSHSLSINEDEIWGHLFPQYGFELLIENTDCIPRELIRLAVTCVKEAINNGHLSIFDSDMHSAIKNYSESRLDDLASERMYDLPGLKLVTRQFAGGKKEFNLDYVQEKAYRLLAREKPAGDEAILWAEAGFEKPLELARRLVKSGFLMAKEGRDASGIVMVDDEVDALDENHWYAIHPMYHAGLALEGACRAKQA